MASATKPGGGATNGHGAQEENLHKRTDVYRFLFEQLEQEKRDWSTWSGPPSGGLLYPIPDNGCLLSDRVAVSRGPEKKNDPFLGTPFQISVISCAAVYGPRLAARRQYAAARDRERV
eukprot:15445435-Alexandrium_andersonii.AAC.1